MLGDKFRTKLLGSILNSAYKSAMASTLSSARKPATPPAVQPGSSDVEIWEYFQTIRWPGGFVCPECGWQVSEEWAKTRRRQLRAAGDIKVSSFSLLPKARGRIVCPGCGKHVSLTSGTMLAGTRISPSILLTAAGCFLRAVSGISAVQLNREAGLGSTLTAVRLIKKFYKVAVPDKRDKLRGTVHLDCGIATIGSARRSKAFRVVVAVEEADNGKAGKIALLYSPEPKGIFWIPGFPQPIMRGTRVVARSGEIEGLLRAWNITPELVHGPEGELLPLCASVLVQVNAFLRKTFRGAISPRNVQLYLHTLSFCWNHRDQGKKATHKLIRRLLQKPQVDPELYAYE